jgi:AcrR family transcriptional regulator
MGIASLACATIAVVAPEEESGWNRRRNLLLAEYEQIAWKLFAQHGFRAVTVDEIAEAAGVAARTLFRYFPTKEDFLLGFTRRGLQVLVDLIAALEPNSDPVRNVWQLIRSHLLQDPQDVRLLTLWRRAAADAPEIHARVRGERLHALTEVVMDYCARSKGRSGPDDPDPRLLAGLVVGVEMAVIELWGRSSLELPEIFEAAEAAVPDLVRKRRAGRP